MAEGAANVALVRLRMYHTDLAGIFHGRVFDLFEEARTEVFRRHGFAIALTEARGIALVVTGCDASFHRPLRLDDELAVAVFVSALSRARVAVAYEVRRPGQEEVAVTGHTAFAFFDRARGRPVAVPPEIRLAIARCPAMLRIPGS